MINNHYIMTNQAENGQKLERTETEQMFSPNMRTLQALKDNRVPIEEAQRIEGSIGTSLQMQPLDKSTSCIKEVAKLADVSMEDFHEAQTFNIAILRLKLDEVTDRIQNIVPATPEFANAMCKDLLLLRGLVANLKSSNNEPLTRYDVFKLIKSVVRNLALQKVLNILLNSNDSNLNLKNVTSLFEELIEGTDIAEEIAGPQAQIGSEIAGQVRRGADPKDPGYIGKDLHGNVIITQ